MRALKILFTRLKTQHNLFRRGDLFCAIKSFHNELKLVDRSYQFCNIQIFTPRPWYCPNLIIFNIFSQKILDIDQGPVWTYSALPCIRAVSPMDNASRNFVWIHVWIFSPDFRSRAYVALLQLYVSILAIVFFYCLLLLTLASVFKEFWWSGYVSASQTKGRIFEAHHNPCSLLGVRQHYPAQKKKQKNCM